MSNYDRQAAKSLHEDLLLGGDGELHMIFNQGCTFFEPDMEFINWIKDYADGRMIIEIGVGTGRVIHQLQAAGHHKLLGVEPSWDYMHYTQECHQRGQQPIHVMPWYVERAAKMITDLTKDNKAMVLVCRPCHSNFVEETFGYMSEGSELMYITIPENLTKYSDLGAYQDELVHIQHKGKSTDKEVVHVIRKR